MLTTAARLGISEEAFWDMLPREFARRARAQREELERQGEIADLVIEAGWRQALFLRNVWAEEPITWEEFTGEGEEPPTPEEWAALNDEIGARHAPEESDPKESESEE
jgi:hypothetical protein